MPINSLEFATKFTGEVDKQLNHKSVTAFMEDSGFKAKFVGAKTVMIPEVDMLALGDYDRDTGFAKGSVTVSNTAYTLTQDRSREFNIDREDMDETGVANLAGEVVSEFNRMKVVPEIDEYSISKVAAVAKAQNHYITTEQYPIATKAYAAFDEALTATKEIVGEDMELVAFVSYKYWAALKSSPEIQKLIVTSDFKNGEVNREVKSIDNVKFIPVPESRLYSAYDSLDGSAGAEYVGGLTPADTAKKIHLLILSKDTARRVRKLEKIKIFTPDQNQDMDAWKFQYRLYYDVLIKNSRKAVPHMLIEDNTPSA